MALLEVRDLAVRFGGAVALDGVRLAVSEGEVTAVLGRNGAGKTTLLRCLAGAVRPSAGSVELAGRPVGGGPARTARRGVRLVTETGNVFTDLTVTENLWSGAYWLRAGAFRARLAELVAAFPILDRLLTRRGGELSGGERQFVAVTRVLMAGPSVVLLDEPSLGLSPKLAGELLASVVRRAREDGAAVVVAEQNARLALRFCDRAHLLETGRLVRSGSAAEIGAAVAAGGGMLAGTT